MYRTWMAVLLLCAAGPGPAAPHWGLPAASRLRPQAPKPGPEVGRAVHRWRAAHEAEVVRSLADLLALPNVASDTAAIGRNAERILALLEARGARGRLLDGLGGPPVVYAELDAPGARRTVVVYAHYDGQPVDPAKWTSPPWTPVLRTRALDQGGKDLDLQALPPGPMDPEWRLYGRSASDDKGTIVAVLAALDALKAAGIARSVRLKFFFEGEEEAGSPHLTAVLAANRALLEADGWLLGDGPVHQTRRPQLFFGARGVTGLEITAYGPLRPLHSGHYGNWAPNPAVQIAHVVAGLRDLDGRIAVAGFYDDVRPLSAAEKAALDQVPAVDDALRAEYGLAATEAGGAALVQRIMLPALNVRGLQAGGVGERAANAIPAEAHASIDFRLVPDQTPAGVRARVEAHLKARGFALVDHAPTPEERRATPRLLRLQWDGGYAPARTPIDAPFSRAVAGAIEDTLGAPLVKMPMLGGSIPMSLFADATGRPIVGLPIANHDNNQHAADENLRLQNLWDGIVAYAAVFASLGARLQ